MPLPDSALDSEFVRGLARCLTARQYSTHHGPSLSQTPPCDNPTHLSPEIWHLLQGAMYGYRPKSLKRVSAQLLGMATAVVLTRWHFGK